MSSIKNRVWVLFYCLGALCVIVGTIGAWAMTEANKRARSTYEQVTLPTEYLEATYRLQLLTVITTMNAIASEDSATRRKNTDEAEALRRESDRQSSLFAESQKSDTTRELAQKFIQDRALAMAAVEDVIRLVRNGDVNSASDTIISRVRPPGLSEADDIAKLIPMLREHAQQAYSEGIADLKLIRLWISALLIIGGSAIGFFVWTQMRSLVSGLQNIEEVLREVSQTLDLSRRAKIVGNNEISRTASSFNALLTRIEIAVQAVSGASNVVRDAAGEIVSGNVDLSSRTEEQAASLEETSASVMELGEAVKRNAAHAMQAKMLARNASDMADAGNVVVREMVSSIEQIRVSSVAISDINGLINGIAFQTNILALNAAVEAARAGDHGRGFAVVATEVRNLAQRSAAAAKQIDGLISASVSVIQSGAAQTAHVSEKIDAVMQVVRNVAEVVTDISSASDEQRHAIGQILQAIGQIDQVTQQNAGLAGRASSVAQSLHLQASQLKETVSAFRVGKV